MISLVLFSEMLDHVNNLFSLPFPSLQFVVVVYVALLIDGLPWLLILSGLLAHVLFGSLLSTFPIISLLSPGFIGGTCMFRPSLLSPSFPPSLHLP